MAEELGILDPSIPPCFRRPAVDSWSWCCCYPKRERKSNLRLREGFVRRLTRAKGENNKLLNYSKHAIGGSAFVYMRDI